MLNRRTFATFCGAAPSIAAMAASSPQAGVLEAFRELSARLTGFPASALDSGFAAALWRDLSETSDVGRQSALKTLLARPNANGADDECADCGAVEVEIIAAWYSGILPHTDGPVVATLHDGLIWRTAWFARPPSVCAPLWEQPPAAR